MLHRGYIATAPALLATLLVTVMIFPMPLEAARPAPKPKSKFRSINQKLDNTKTELKKIRQSEDITLKDIEDISRRMSKIRNEHRRRKQTLDEAGQNLEIISREVASLQKKVSSNKKWLKRKLRAMNRYGKHGDTLLILGSSKDLTEFMIRWRYLEKLAGNEQKAITSFTSAIDDLRIKKADLQKAYSRYKVEEERVRETAQSIKQEMDKKERMLMSVRREKQAYSRMEYELKREAARLKKVISQTAREKVKTYSYGGFRKGRGRLKWPVRGNVAIPFGTQNSPKAHTPVFRNGIYISAPEDTVATSVGDGKVVFADWFEGYGQLVIINHGSGYHTLYANLSEIFLSTGDIIKSKDKVGRVGTSGILNNPALYFEIRYKGKPLDPMDWLAK